MCTKQPRRTIPGYEATNRGVGSGDVDVGRLGCGRSGCRHRPSGRRLWARRHDQPRVLGPKSLVPRRFLVPPDPEPCPSAGDVGHERLPHLLSRRPGPGQSRSRYLRRTQSSTATEPSAPGALSASASWHVLEHVDSGALPWRLAGSGASESDDDNADAHHDCQREGHQQKTDDVFLHR
jgi:hypothetical protein